jgi:hypothetical protein
MSDGMDKVLDSGNLEDIDALLEKLEEGFEPEAAVAAVESSDTVALETVPADPPSQDEPVVAHVDEPVVEEPPVLLAKDGKNHIPFSVLEGEREQNAAMRNQLEEMMREKALLTQQLESASITPKELPEKMRFTDEQLEEFESYGDLGEGFAIVAKQVAILQAQSDAAGLQPGKTAAPQQPDTNAFATNPDTLRWANDDGHWAMVESVNSVLDSDPAWSTKPHSERIPEIVRRTKLALGEAAGIDVTATAAAAVTAAQRVAPNSLTDVGGEVPGQTKSIADQLAEGDTSDVEAFLSKQMAAGKSADEVLTALLI